MYHRPMFKKVLIAVACLGLTWLVVIQHNDVAPSLTITADSYEFVNEAQFYDDWVKNPMMDENKFHLITNVVLVTHKNYSYNLSYEFKRLPTMKDLSDRQREIERCLQSDLNHPRVAAIHILYSHPDVLSYLRRLKMNNTKKMVLHLNKREPTVSENLVFIQTHFKNKHVILKHQDNFLGEGWEDVDFKTMREKSLMYALTRHAISLNASCSPGSSCHDGAAYIGSHDTFVFRVDKEFPKTMLKDMDIVPSSNGMENLMIWYFRDVMKYKVTNPCKKLKIYHVHCVPIRETGRKRYNSNGKSGMAAFTSDLS